MYAVIYESTPFAYETDLLELNYNFKGEAQQMTSN